MPEHGPRASNILAKHDMRLPLRFGLRLGRIRTWVSLAFACAVRFRRLSWASGIGARPSAPSAAGVIKKYEEGIPLVRVFGLRAAGHLYRLGFFARDGRPSRPFGALCQRVLSWLLGCRFGWLLARMPPRCVAPFFPAVSAGMRMARNRPASPQCPLARRIADGTGRSAERQRAHGPSRAAPQRPAHPRRRPTRNRSAVFRFVARNHRATPPPLASSPI